MTTSVPVDTLFELEPSPLAPPLSLETVQRSVDAIRVYKEEVEAEILKFIRAKIDVFGTETGVYPSSINIQLTRYQFMGDKSPRHLITDVTLDVSL